MPNLNQPHPGHADHAVDLHELCAVIASAIRHEAAPMLDILRTELALLEAAPLDRHAATRLKNTLQNFASTAEYIRTLQRQYADQ